jgi:hypothetical protein
LRDDAEIEEIAASAAQTPVTPPTANPVFTQSQSPSATAATAAPVEDFPPDHPGAEPEQTLFTEFLMGIASSAFVYLGLVEHPATGRRQVDPMAARESIEMLVMLRDKTKGNLTRGEEKFFNDLLADLKMQYVSLNRR